MEIHLSATLNNFSSSIDLFSAVSVKKRHLVVKGIKTSPTSFSCVVKVVGNGLCKVKKRGVCKF